MQWAVLLMTAVALAGCKQAGAEQQSALSDAIKNLQTDVAATKARLEVIDASLNAIIQTERERNQHAILDPSDSSFQRVDSSVASFAVSIDNVTARADGVAVRLMVGVLSSATINGATIVAEYGARYPEPKLGATKDWAREVKEWEEALQKREVEINDSMRSGRWNPVTLPLPNIRPEQFGYLSVRIRTPSISLMQ